MSGVLEVGGNRELEHYRGVSSTEELGGIALDHAEHVPDGLRLSDLNEYSDSYLEIIESKYPYLLEKELQSYRFADANGRGSHHMVSVRDNIRDIDGSTHNKVRVALQAVPHMQPEDVPRHNDAFRQLRASIEALEQVSLVESATSSGSIDCTFTYAAENHVPFMSLLEVVFDNPDIMPSRTPSLET